MHPSAEWDVINENCGDETSTCKTKKKMVESIKDRCSVMDQGERVDNGPVMFRRFFGISNVEPSLSLP
jgi:hypothetical protein